MNKTLILLALGFLFVGNACKGDQADRAFDKGVVGDRGLEPLTSTVCRKRRKKIKCI